MSRRVSRYVPPSPFAPLPLGHIDPSRTRTPTCSRCGRDIVFVEMADTGKLMPCDTRMVPGDGSRSLAVRWPRGKAIVGRVVTKAPVETSGLEPHFGTCPCRPGTVAISDARPTQPSLFD